MTSQSAQWSEGDFQGASAACIEAQDVLYAEPLREYLERNGCRVMVNTVTQAPLLYHISIGDAEFVKAIYARHTITAQKKLAVVYGADDSSLSTLIAGGTKLYLIDGHPLTDIETRTIFSFFFTGKPNRIDARKEPVPLKHVSVIPKEPSREPQPARAAQVATDAKRIAQTMQQVFSRSERVGVKRKSRKGNRIVVRWLFGLLAICGLPLLIFFTSLGLSGGFLALSAKMLLVGNIPWTETCLRYSRANIQNAQIVLDLTSPAFHLIGLGGYAEDEDRLLSVLSDAAQAETGVITIFQNAKNVGSAILFPKSASSDAGISDVTALTSDVNRVSQHLALVQAELDSLLSSQRFPFQTMGVRSLGQKGLAALTGVRELIRYTERLLTLYPQMAGFRRRQTYLVLLQNSMELRPTGGFIGSMLLVSFIDGKVDDMHVLDVYDADGQLKGHIDPPQPIREIIGQEHWYLRDSNWDPDFAVSGKQAGWFYEKEMGQPVDGVIALSLPFVTHLLHVLGPVELSDFNDRISESNFFAKSLLYTQTDFFPGSTQKKDFLGALTNALLLRMTGDTSISAGALLRSIADSIQSRDIQFYYNDPALEHLVTQWGWDGGMRMALCQTIVHESACVGDGLGIVEANLGINKVNYFVTHEALSDINIQDNGTIDQTLTVKIKNTTPTQPNVGGGVYQTYFRVYYPKDTDVQSVTFDGQAVPQRTIKQLVPPPAPYVITDASGSSTIVSVPFAVAPRTEHQLVIHTRRHMQPLSDSLSYQFTIRKQAGMSSYPWHVVIHYPAAWTALSDSGLAKPGTLEYNTDLTTDAHLRILFRSQP